MQLNIIQAAIYLGCALLLFIYRELSVMKNSKLPRMPLSFLVVYCLIKAAIPIFEYNDLASTADSLDVAATIVVWMAALRIIFYFVIDYFLRQKKGYVVPTITRDFALVILYVIVAMIVLKHKTDVNLGSLLTTSAILTAVIGFAMQDTLGNLFSGLAIQVEHPYQIGDWIGFEGVIGRVEGITWKSTKILTSSDEMIFVPNNTISKSLLKNYSRPTQRHTAFIEIGVSYDALPAKVRAAMTSAIKDHSRVLAQPQPEVRMTKYGDFAINYKAIFATDDFGTEERTKSEILNAIWYRFRRDGIKIPYPIQETLKVDVNALNERAHEDKEREEGEISRLLGKIDIFAGLTEPIRRELATQIAVLQYAAGENIVMQADAAGPMYIIKEGECAVLVSHDGMEQIEVARLKSSQFFGEMSVLTGAARTATVKALSDVVCYEVEKSDLQSIIGKNPEVVSAIGSVLIERKAGLDESRVKTLESGREQEQQGQLLSKIKSFLGF